MVHIHALLDKLQGLKNKRDDIVKESGSSLPYSSSDEKELQKIKEESNKLEHELKESLKKKYDELSINGQVQGYSNSDFQSDMRVSYQKVIEKLDKLNNHE